MVSSGGIVLCGGRSTRMGECKALLPFGAETMLQRVVRILMAVTEPVVVVSAPGQRLPSLPAAVVIAQDTVEGRGPLEGLAAGLEALGTATDRAFLTSCDVPFLSPAFVRRMLEFSAQFLVCVPRANGFDQTLAAVYSRAILPTLHAHLAAGRYRPAELFAAVATRFVGAEELAECDPALQSLRNVNTPADYQAALADAGLLRCGETGDRGRGG